MDYGRYLHVCVIKELSLPTIIVHQNENACIKEVLLNLCFCMSMDYK